MNDANVKLVRDFYAAFDRGDIATVIATLTPDVEWGGNGRAKDYPLFGMRKGQAAVQKFFQELVELEDITEFSPRDFLADGDKVVVLGNYGGKIRKTGRPFSTDWAHVFTIRDGKIARFVDFLDTAQFVEASR
ncbi:MAG: nuclear transport factor 2 family protein [Xanthobacteraceae bacterium]